MSARDDFKPRKVALRLEGKGFLSALGDGRGLAKGWGCFPGAEGSEESNAPRTGPEWLGTVRLELRSPWHGRSGDTCEVVLSRPSKGQQALDSLMEQETSPWM